MKLQRARQPIREDGLLPLINIVFLLLIFFMVVGRLSAVDPFPIDPPASSSHAPAPADQDSLVALGPQGRLALDGIEMTEEDLLSALADRVGRRESVQVHIKADGAADAVMLVALMERLRQTGLTEVTLLAVTKAGL